MIAAVFLSVRGLLDLDVALWRCVPVVPTVIVGMRICDRPHSGLPLVKDDG